MGVRVCIMSGCGALVERGNRCQRHRYRDRRPSSAQRGYGARWRHFARRFLRDHPVCEHAGCHAPSSEVHHRDGRGPLGPAGYDETNLQALCGPHHAKVTAQMQPGGWAATQPRRDGAEGKAR